VFQLSFQLLTSQPITNIILNATHYLNIDTENWTLATARGIWTRTASEWIICAQTAGVEWGMKQGIQARKSEITTRINTISGDKYSCRPLKLVDSSPFPLPLIPTQVFIITTASEIVATTNGKVKGYVHGPLSLKLKLKLLERLVHACISSLCFPLSHLIFIGHTTKMSGLTKAPALYKTVSNSKRSFLMATTRSTPSFSSHIKHTITWVGFSGRSR
jgi:hypothetical protein